MAYKDRYRQSLESVPGYAEFCGRTGKRLVLGYTSDLDILIHWDVKVFNQILEDYLQEKPSLKDGETIDSLQDFARMVSHYMLLGGGGEADISSFDVCKMLEERFITTPGLGGTCAQGAAAMAQVGIPLIAHISDRSEPVCRFLEYEEVCLVSPQGKAVPAMEYCSGKEPVKHFILQYAKGDILKIFGKEYTIPLSNRLILDYDTLHKDLPVDDHFLTYCEEHAGKIPSYNVSGYNAIVSKQILAKTLDKMSAHYKRVKENNADCILYLEGAHYLNFESKKMVFTALGPYLDIMGMNEEELEDLAQRIGYSLDLESLPSIIGALECVIEEYPVKGLVVHSKDYALYYGAEIPGVDLEQGLTLGNLLSGTRARTGHYGNVEECEESLSLPLSPVGLNFANQLEKLELKQKMVLVPSKYREHPTTTIGLGDTFVAGMQICFIR